MTPRFFVEPKQITGDRVVITGEELVHLARVLRLRSGSSITICDGSGQEYQAILEEISPDVALAKITKTTISVSEPRVKMTLVQGLPKADKMDWIVQKGTELGIYEFLPVFSQRTVVQLSGAKAQKRVDRWQRIAKEAAKQSRRTVVPKVNYPISWRECLARYSERAQGRLGLFPWEAVADRGLREALSRSREWRQAGESLDMWLFIGPEGGWSEGEAGEASAMGIVAVSLGPRILRTETAGIVAAALVFYESGDLG